jgi:SAM-dependent methyltransferase
MVDLARRAGLKENPELMELRACLRDIARVNRLTMAYRPTMEWLERVVGSLAEVEGTLALPEELTSQGRDPGLPILGRPLRIVDIGCGYGDMLRRIERWAMRRGVAVELIGVDLNADAVRAAREATERGSRIAWLVGDVSTCAEAQDADVVISSLLTHHLEEREIVRLLEWMEGTARVGWFVNDLHRQAVPYFVFRAMGTVMGWHRFVQHDGLVSIRRSFVVEDWRRMCGAAGLDAGMLRIAEYRPARLCVGRVKDGQ